MTDRLQQALELHRTGDIDGAHAIYTELLNENPHNTAVVYLISLIALKINKHLDAVNLIVHAVKTQNDEPLYYFALGYFTQDLGWDDQSVQAYQNAIVLNPEHYHALSNLGRLHTQFNRYEDAIRSYKAALQINPQTYAAYIGLAITLNRMGLEADALETLQIAIQLRPDLPLENESTQETLTRLDKGEPILYQPPLMIPEAAGTPKAPHIAKQKPKLRIVHQLAVSGGATVSKCLSVLPDCTLFNNIHPRNGEIKTYGQNIFAQAANWYSLFTQADKETLSGQEVTFSEGVRLIYDRLQEQEKAMIIRSWSHIDFIGTPFIDDPQETLALSDILREDFELIEAATLRHPVDHWVNLQRLQLMKSLDLETFLKGYLSFTHAVEHMDPIHYEDFAISPDEKMQELCQRLQIPFNSIYKERWKFESRLESEYDEDLENISPVVTKHHSEALLESFESNFDYWPILKATGYKHPEATSSVL